MEITIEYQPILKAPAALERDKAPAGLERTKAPAASGVKSISFDNLCKTNPICEKPK